MADLTGLPHPGQVSGSVIVADNGLGPLAEALGGQGHKLPQAEHDGHSAHGHSSAVFGKLIVKGDLDQAFCNAHGKGRYTQSHDGQEHLLFHLEKFRPHL